MGLLRRRLLRRFTPLGRIADAFLIAGFALKFGHHRGWISDDFMRSVGLESAVRAKATSRSGAGVPLGDAALGLGALWRFLRRRR